MYPHPPISVLSIFVGQICDRKMAFFSNPFVKVELEHFDTRINRLILNLFFLV